MLEAHADGNRRQEPHHDTQRREPQPFQDQHRLQAAMTSLRENRE